MPGVAGCDPRGRPHGQLLTEANLRRVVGHGYRRRGFLVTRRPASREATFRAADACHRRLRVFTKLQMQSRHRIFVQRNIGAVHFVLLRMLNKENQDGRHQQPQDARAAPADAAIRRSAEAVQQGGRATSDVLRQGAEVGADVERRGVEAGADTARRFADAANDTARRSAQAVADSQRQIVQDAAQKFEEVSRKMAEAAQGTTENVRKLMALPNAAEGGLRDLQQSMAGLVEGVVQTNLRVAQEVFRMSNPAAVVELQQRFAASTRTPCCRTAPRWCAPCAAPRRDPAPARAGDRAAAARAGHQNPGRAALRDAAE
jgi:hypothetical protein